MIPAMKMCKESLLLVTVLGASLPLFTGGPYDWEYGDYAGKS